MQEHNSNNREETKTAKFYVIKKICAQNGSDVGRIDIYGDIDRDQFWGNEITPGTFAAELSALGKVNEIEIHIFSNGGDMFASLAIHDILKSRPEKKIAYVEGCAASGGSVIICACDVVYMSFASMLFIHCALKNPGYVNEHSAKNLMEDLQKYKEPMAAAYVAKSGRTREEVIALMDGVDGNGTWMTAAEAIEFGLADGYTPEAKLPLEAVAMIAPGIYNYRGCRIDLTMFDKAGSKSAGIINSTRGGSNTMAFWNKPKQAKTAANTSPKAEITLVEMVCPSCGGTVNMNPETGEIIPGAKGTQTQPGNGAGAAGAAPAPPAAPNAGYAMARCLPSNNVKAVIFTVPCPHCGESFNWDTDANIDGKEGDQTNPAVPFGGATPPAGGTQAPANNAPAPAPAPAQQPGAAQAPAAQAAQAVCPNCGGQVSYDTATAQKGTDQATGAEGYLLTCSGCKAQFLEPLAAADPNSIPVGASAAIQAAYRAGIQAERERNIALDEMAQAAPAMASMLQAAKKTGASADVMRQNLIKAMASGKIGGNPAAQFAAALGNDVRASGVNALVVPQHGAPPKSIKESAYQKYVDEYNKARGGNDNAS